MPVIIDEIEYMDVREAAEFLKVSQAKVAKLLKNGSLPAYKDMVDERRKLIRVEDLVKARTPQLHTVKNEEKEVNQVNQSSAAA